MPPDLSAATLALLAGAAFVAGTVDAIAGGGGLVTVPALLAAGLPPQLALGTNKGQSVFGSGVSLLRFARAGLVDGARARIAFPCGLAGSLAGAAALTMLSPRLLKPIVLGLLVFAGLVVGLRRGPPRVEARVPARLVGLATAAIALVIGAYDGFFGPGTGTFLIVAFASLLGDSLQRASGEAKVVNFASNLAAVALFSARGTILWQVALPMAAAQAAGGFLGAHLAIRRGDVLVRRVVLVVVLALVAKLGRDLLGS
jgi:uncharacterized membrane protein YfcA